MKTWDIQKTQFKVADFVNWARGGELNLSPMFQRRSVWSKGAKSYLIDTVLRGLPVPPIILRDIPPDIQTFKSIREVVDGQQRLRTLLTFIAPQVVNDFDANKDGFTISRSHNLDLSGKSFRDLPNRYQRQILDYQFMVHIFPSETDDREILEIFARMNATGSKLNNQELRNAEFFGEFKTQSFALASEHLNLWRKWKLFTEAGIARMQEVEFTSELMILVIRGISDNTKGVISKAYREYDDVFASKDEVAKRVRHVLKVLDDSLVGELADVLEYKSIVYSLCAALYDQAFGMKSSLEAARPRRIADSAIRAMGKRAADLLSRNAPSDIQTAYDARSSQARNRIMLYRYLLGEGQR